jgi:hypothetical protein
MADHPGCLKPVGKLNKVVRIVAYDLVLIKARVERSHLPNERRPYGVQLPNGKMELPAGKISS